VQINYKGKWEGPEMATSEYSFVFMEKGRVFQKDLTLYGNTVNTTKKSRADPTLFHNYNIIGQNRIE
jgi:hypothetical protein